MRVATHLLIVILIIAITTAALAVTRGLKRYSEPLTAPDFNLLDLDGVYHRITDYRGSVVIVNFWAVWCRPCVKEMPSLQNASDILRVHNVQTIAVNVGDTADQIRTFLKRQPLTIQILLDQQSKVSASWKVMAMPTTYILDPTGKIVIRVVGEYEWDDPVLLEQIRSISNNNSSLF